MLSVLAPLIVTLATAAPAAAGPVAPAPAQAATPAAGPEAEPAAPTAREPSPARGRALLESAAGDLERIRKAFKEVLARVEDARYEKDLVKLLCADERLSQIKVLVSVAEKADVALAEAVSAKDDAAEIEVSKIAIARGKADALRAQAAECIGQLAYDVGGRTEVVVEESQELPESSAEGSNRLATASDHPTADASPFRQDFGLPLPGWR